MKSKKGIEIPIDFAKALKKVKNALEIFEAMPPSHQKEYVEAILEAKKEETRKKRISNSIKIILDWKKRK